MKEMNEEPRLSAPLIAPLIGVTPLTGKQRQHLRRLAHPLKALVHIGQMGLTEAILLKTRQELEAHELIKVKVGEGCEDPRREILTQLAEEAGAICVQILGRVGTLYRRRRKDATIILPKD
jgi:RNA-binding protein